MLSPKQAAQPNPSYPRPMSSGHHISMEQINSDTDASNNTYLKEIHEKRKKKLFLRKNEKRKRKSEKKEGKIDKRKKEKRAPKEGYLQEGSKK